MSFSFPHQIIFVRHAQTTYSNVFPDITPEGVEQLQCTAKTLQSFIVKKPHADLTIITSPALRAQGSAGVLAEELHYKGNIRTEPLLRDMHVRDWPRAKELFQRCLMNGGRVEDVYDVDDRFEDTNIFEPRSSIQKRFFHYMRQLHEKLSQFPEPQCVLAVSHFEVLNHFLRSLWPDAPWLRYSSFFRITMDHPISHGRQAIVTYGECSININASVLLQEKQATS